MSVSTTTFFVCLDDFARNFEDRERHHLIPTSCQRRRKGQLSLGEMLFVMGLFHLSAFKDFRHFWLCGIEQKYRDCFGDLPSYGRFVALTPLVCAAMHADAQPLGRRTGIYVADSTKLAVFANPRISRNRVFDGMARRGKTTTGWFSISNCMW